MSHVCEFREKASQRLLSVRNPPLTLTPDFVAHLAVKGLGLKQPLPAELLPARSCGQIRAVTGGLELVGASAELACFAEEGALQLIFTFGENMLCIEARLQPGSPVIDVCLHERLWGFAAETHHDSVSLDSRVIDELVENWNSAQKQEEEVVFRRQPASAPARGTALAETESPPTRRLKKLSAIEEGLCPICYVPFCGEPATLPPCNHRFCFPCIEEWARVTNVCPLCKAEFLHIKRGAESVPVERRKAQHVYEETSEDRIIRNADDYCYACERSDNFNFMLICDKCLKKCCHMRCLDPPLEFLPESDWFCDYCVEEHGLDPTAPTANIFRRTQVARRRPQQTKRKKSRTRRGRPRTVNSGEDWLCEDAPVVRFSQRSNESSRTQNSRRRARVDEENRSARLDTGIKDFFSFVERSQARPASGTQTGNRQRSGNASSRARRPGLRERNFDMVFEGFLNEMFD